MYIFKHVNKTKCNENKFIIIQGVHKQTLGLQDMITSYTKTEKKVRMKVFSKILSFKFVCLYVFST